VKSSKGALVATLILRPKWPGCKDQFIDDEDPVVLQCNDESNTKEAPAMKTISLKLPETLRHRLERAARERGQSKSEVVRAALEQFFNGERVITPGSALEAVQPWIGCVEGPGDLSTNPKYMEGFGE
jgi:hypothetical protein